MNVFGVCGSVHTVMAPMAVHIHRLFLGLLKNHFYVIAKEKEMHKICFRMFLTGAVGFFALSKYLPAGGHMRTRAHVHGRTHTRTRTHYPEL